MGKLGAIFVYFVVLNLDTIIYADQELIFHPKSIDQLEEGDITDVTFRVNTTETLYVRIQCMDLKIAQVVTEQTFVVDGFTQNVASVSDNGTSDVWNSTGHVTVKGLFLGRTALIFTLETQQKQEQASYIYNIAVIRPLKITDIIFLGLVTVFVICAKIGMGCKIDMTVIKEVLKRPIAPIIGFCCQFIIMPLVAYGVARFLGFTGGIALGMFLCGCAPGGGSSNMFTYLLHGDVSLSVTMTTLSVIASIGMIPLWLFTLGQYFITDDMNVTIPFQNIFFSLLGIIIPLSIGVVIQYKRPKVAKIIRKFLKPFFCLIIIVMFTLGFYTNLFIFQLFTPFLILAGCLLPYLGFILAAIVAAICKQSRSRILTIAIETGIQNTGIPIMLMKYSLPQPDADLSLVAPVVVAMFTPLPLWIMIAAREIYMRCCKKEKEKEFQMVPFEEAPQDPEKQPVE